MSDRQANPTLPTDERVVANSVAAAIDSKLDTRPTMGNTMHRLWITLGVPSTALIE